jgi:hypothetical protein
MARPDAFELNTLTYPDYVRMYSLSHKKTKSNYLGKDRLGYWVHRRETPIIIRYQHLRVEDTERFFTNNFSYNYLCDLKMNFLEVTKHIESTSVTNIPFFTKPP